jgi:hypothetical protein
MPTWVKFLLAVAAILVLGIAAVMGTGYYFYRKIADAPGGAKAAVVRLANPGYEILSVDEIDKTITVRHKKSGKQATIPFESLKGGAINPKDLGMTNEEAGIRAAPAWAQYPGATVESTAGNLSTIQMTLKTGDAPEKIFEYYSEQLKANGYEVSSVSLTRTLAGSSKDRTRNATIQILPGRNSETGVLVVLIEKGAQAGGAQ